MKIRIVSDINNLKALNYFCKTVRTSYDSQKTDFELWCVSKNNNICEQDILINLDNTYRSNSFLNGYYVTDHFGKKAYLISRGTVYFLFAEDFECIVWPYFVKYFLTLHSINNNSLHIKAAAVEWNNSSTLLIGRGGAGKTVFLTKLCQNGAKFITNSHSILEGKNVTGVLSSIRIRPDGWHGNLLDKIKQTTAIKKDEIIVNPCDIFEINNNKKIKVKNILILNFKKGYHEIQNISTQEAYNYAEQFALGINVYRLEEDLLDLYDGNYKKFSEIYDNMKIQLMNLIKKSICYHISGDILVDKYKDDILKIL